MYESVVQMAMMLKLILVLHCINISTLLNMPNDAVNAPNSPHGTCAACVAALAASDASKLRAAGLHFDDAAGRERREWFQRIVPMDPFRLSWALSFKETALICLQIFIVD